MIMYDWAEKYGDIMKISLFNTPMVVVNSTELAYDVLVKTGKSYFFYMMCCHIYLCKNGLPSEY